MPTTAGGGGLWTGLRAGAAAALCALAPACATDEGGEFGALAGGTVIGSVTGLGGTPLDSVHIDLTVPSQVSGLFSVVGGAGRTDAEGRFSVPVQIIDALDQTALPDTLAIYITATALPPRYTPPAGEPAVRDSALVAVALAPEDEPVPVTEVDLSLPVAPAAAAVAP